MGRRVRTIGVEGSGESPLYYSTHEVGRLLNVSPSTVQNMLDAGQLQGWRTAGGHRRISPESVHALLQRAPGSLASAGQATRVMVVEDDKNLSKLYKAKIASWKLPVELVTAEDGLEALVLIGKQPPDVLIVDVNVPKVDGVELIRRLRLQPELRSMEIVVVTGLDATALAKRGGLPDGVAVFRKPVPFDELKGFLRGCVARRGATATA